MAPTPPSPDRPPAVAPAPPAHVDHKPEVFPPAWKVVGVGQTISFGVPAIDQDLDETRVEVSKMPTSAKFDALTQTVTWTPTKADMPKGVFELTVKQAATPGGAWTREEKVTFEITVDAKKQPVPEPEPQNGVVETILTIHQPARLHEVNLDWPIDKMLATSAELFRATLPPEVQEKLGKVDKKALYKSFLVGLAETHQNKRLDPGDAAFDKVAFGSPRDWKIVTVRPRLDKKWQELRIVYQAVKAPEPVFAMFRLRPTWDTPAVPPDGRERNNAIFSQLVARFLLGKEAGVHPRWERDAKGHGRALSHFVEALMTYQPPKPRKGRTDPPAPPWQRAAFVALPTEARMGGGSARDDAGGYRSGDGWAWGVMKPMPTADGKSQAYVNMPIPGFWTQAVPGPDGKAWMPKCAPRFDPDDPKHAAGYEVLCRKAQGFVDLPAMVDGKVTPSKRDAVNLFVEHKRVHAVALLPLDDGRRDHGEENGMTCAQCHIRNFGVRDRGDPATADASAGTPKAGNHKLQTLNFQIIPTTSWEAFTLEFNQDQECRAKLLVEKALNQPSALTCPLAPK